MDSSNPYEKYLPLFEKWPEVTAAPVRGEPGLRVAGEHETPEDLEGAAVLNFCAKVIWGVLLVCCLIAVHPHLKNNEYFGTTTCVVLAFIAWITLSVLTHSFLRERGLEKTIVLISPSHIQIGDKLYDAKVQHKFTMDLHRKAKEEADAELRVQQRGKDNAHIRHERHYRDGYHIFLEYLGQRILVTDIYGEEMAEKFLRALVAVDKIVHKEKTVFVANANGANMSFGSDMEESTKKLDYFGTRPALD